MTKKNNDDMAGSVSEPKGAIPEVKPAKSLWPRPHETVRVEPVLDPPRQEAPPVLSPAVPPVLSPVETLAAYSAEPENEEIDHAPELRAPEVRIEPEDEVEAPLADEPEEAAPEPVIEDEPAFEREPEPVLETPAEDETHEEPVLAAAPSIAVDEPVLAAEPEPVVEPVREHRDHRHVSVLDAADRETPALDDPREGNTGKFVAMAAGIVVALALGTVAFVYGSSALGLNFGGESGGTQAAQSDTTAAASTPSTTPAMNPEELKAMEERVAALQAELDRLKQEKPAAPAAQNASPAPGPVASIPGPTPAPNAANAPAATPAPTPAPAPQAAAPAPASEPTPSTSTSNTANETARVEPTPAPPPPAAIVPPPPPAPKPKPQETARAEPVPAPPPSYQTQPSYQQPREAATPEMPVLQNWAVRDVYNGIAVVQGGRGAPLEVEPGDELPGGNRVLAIRRLGGNWAVITERGIISGN